MDGKSLNKQKMCDILEKSILTNEKMGLIIRLSNKGVGAFIQRLFVL